MQEISWLGKELCSQNKDTIPSNQLDMSIFIYTRMYEYACVFIYAPACMSI
jgi:hypothetical protein